MLCDIYHSYPQRAKSPPPLTTLTICFLFDKLISRLNLPSIVATSNPRRGPHDGQVQEGAVWKRGFPSPADGQGERPASAGWGRGGPSGEEKSPQGAGGGDQSPPHGGGGLRRQVPPTRGERLRRQWRGQLTLPRQERTLLPGIFFAKIN